MKRCEYLFSVVVVVVLGEVMAELSISESFFMMRLF